MTRTRIERLTLVAVVAASLFAFVGYPARAQTQGTGGTTGPAAATDGAATLNSDLSRLYMKEATTAFNSKEWTVADRLVGIALEFNPNNSDAYYLRGEMLFAHDKNIPGAISAYTEALSRSSWHQFDASTCKLSLAPLLIRTKQYERAFRLLETITSDSADYLFEYSSALNWLGKTTAARNTLQSAMQIYPNDYRFAIERIKIDPIYRQAMAEHFLANQDVGRFPASVLAGLIRDTTNTVVKRKLIALYEARFPPSAEVYAESLLASSSVTSSEIDKFVANGSLSDGNLVADLSRAVANTPAAQYLSRKLSTYTGTVSLDLNGDGIPEETATYASGRLTSLKYDGNQDGVDEYSLTFANGLPSSLTLMEGATAYVLDYSKYPFVSSASVTEGGTLTHYTLIPDHVSADVVAGASSSGFVDFPPRVRPGYIVNRNELFAFSNEVATTVAASAQPVAIWRRSLNDILHMASQWESGSFRYKAVFHGNEKVSAMRDINGNGYYAVKEYYRNGKLWKLTYNGNHGRAPEFILQFDPYPILSWDYDQDGIIDAVEKKLPDGTIVRMFSTKMNGVFNVVTTEAPK